MPAVWAPALLTACSFHGSPQVARHCLQVRGDSATFQGVRRIRLAARQLIHESRRSRALAHCRSGQDMHPFVGLRGRGLQVRRMCLRLGYSVHGTPGDNCIIWICPPVSLRSFLNHKLQELIYEVSCTMKHQDLSRTCTSAIQPCWRQATSAVASIARLSAVPTNLVYFRGHLELLGQPCQNSLEAAR